MQKEPCASRSTCHWAPTGSSFRCFDVQRSRKILTGDAIRQAVQGKLPGSKPLSGEDGFLEKIILPPPSISGMTECAPLVPSKLLFSLGWNHSRKSCSQGGRPPAGWRNHQSPDNIGHRAVGVRECPGPSPGWSSVIRLWRAAKGNIYSRRVED